MDTDSISVISVNEMSCFEKTEESPEKSKSLDSTSIRCEEEYEEISQVKKVNLAQNGIYPNIQKPPFDKDQPALKDACKSLLVAVGILAICIIFIIPLTIIPRTDSIAYQSYWMEIVLAFASPYIGVGLCETLNLTIWTKEASLASLRGFLTCFLLHYIPLILIHMICYYIWSVHLGYNHPLSNLGLYLTVLTWILYQIGLWFFLPSNLLRKQEFRRKLRWYMVYYFWTIVVLSVLELLSHLFLNPPADLQFIVPFMIVAFREFDLLTRLKLVDKIMKHKDEPAAVLVNISVNATYASFVAVRLPDAENATVFCVVAIEFVLHMITTYQIIKEHKKIGDENEQDENMKKNFDLANLILTELTEGFVPILHGISIAMAYYGSNANLLANIGSSYWGEEINDIGFVFISMTMLFIVDTTSAVATSIWLWKTVKINMILEFQRVLTTYWFFMVAKIAYNESAYLMSSDINLGMDSTSKFSWINDEGWSRLIADAKHLTDDEKSLLLNSTILM